MVTAFLFRIHASISTSFQPFCPSISPRTRPNFQRAFLMSTPRLPSVVVQIGTGTDLHGQDPTTASTRACRNAIEFNSLPGLARLLPNGDFNQMIIKVLLGVPEPFLHQVDISAVKRQFPYGQVSVQVVTGGLCCQSGVVLPEQGDKPHDDRTIVVVAAVSIHC